MKDATPMTEQESLEIIHSMIQKAKTSYHDRGISSLLWGTVVTIASLVSFLQIQFQFNLPVDIWFLVMFAIIPQIIISRNENKTIKVKKYEDEAIDTIWTVYGISIFCLVFYLNVVPGITDKILLKNGVELIERNKETFGATKPFQYFIPSGFSLFLILYALPTLVTGVVKKYKPMIIGAIICYVMFLVSCFTETKYDMLCGAVAAISCWLIPGIVLQRKYLKSKASNV